MKRTDITELWPEATKEAIDRLMGINGADVNAAKAEAESLRQQLADAQKKLAAAPENAEKLREVLERATGLETELSELKAANALRELRETVSKDTGVPAELLTGGNDEECRAQAAAILSFAKPSAYPTVPDGGEVNPVSKPTTAQQFAEWFNQQS